MTAADLDPLDSAAAPITQDQSLNSGLSDAIRGLVEQGVPLNVARSMVARGAGPDEVRAELGYRRQQAVRDARMARDESQLEQERSSYGEAGRQSLNSPLQPRAGRFEFRSPGDGMPQVVDVSEEQAAAKKADFARWANQTPGSARQRQYDPQAAAEWDQQVADKNSEMAQRELAISADSDAREARAQADRRVAANNADVRQRIYESRSLPRNQPTEDELARRQAVVRSAQARSNPMEYLGRGDINDWQREVASRGLLGTAVRTNDPRVEVALLESQARTADRRADIDSRQELATQDRDLRRELATTEAEARSKDRETAAAAAAKLAAEEREARATEAALEREARAREAQAAREEAHRQWAAKAEADRLQYEERRAADQMQFERQMAAMRADADMRAKDIDSRLAQFGASNALAQSKFDEETRFRRDQEKRALAKQQEDEAFKLAGAGGIDIMRNNLETPAADQSFKDLAEQADQSWTGFYNSDAVRFDALLSRLGIEDSATRQALVSKYGLGQPLAPGRSGPISAFINWISGPPKYSPPAAR